MSLQSLTGKVVVVTGSARRVGRAIMLGFAEAGAHVVIHHSQSDADADSAADQARAYGAEALVVKADLRHYDDVAALFEQVTRRFGRVDVLVNSASNFESGDFLDAAPEDWDKVMDVNLRAPFWCTQLAGRMMRDAGIAGCIINIADNAGVTVWKNRPLHSVSKAGLIFLTRVTARALAGYQIRANCAVLGKVLAFDSGETEGWKKSVRRLPLKRSGDPADAARAALYLATNDFITGAVLHVDGGEALGDAAYE